MTQKRKFLLSFMSIKNQSIKILGAGISGLVAGITLAKRGQKVEIFEKRQTIGSFFEKDVHSIRNYENETDILSEYKNIGIDIKHTEPIFEEIRFSPSFKSIKIYSKEKPLFYNLLRGNKDSTSIDNQLKEIAENFGVKIYFGYQAKESFLKQINIVATGSKNLNNSNGIAFGSHFKLKNNLKKIEEIYYFLNNSIAPKGYIYLSPFKREFTLVVATTEKKSFEQLKNNFNKFIESNYFIKKMIEESKWENDVSGFAFFSLPKTGIVNNKLYIGEAGGFLDASTGFGLNYAIKTGYLAAKSIIEDKNYDELWQEAIKEKLLKDMASRRKRNSLSDIHYEKIINSLNKTFGDSVEIKDYLKFKNQQ